MDVAHTSPFVNNGVFFLPALLLFRVIKAGTQYLKFGQFQVMTLRRSLSVIITMRTNLRGVLEVLITVNTKNFLIFVAQNCLVIKHF